MPPNTIDLPDRDPKSPDVAFTLTAEFGLTTPTGSPTSPSSAPETSSSIPNSAMPDAAALDADTTPLDGETADSAPSDLDALASISPVDHLLAELRALVAASGPTGWHELRLAFSVTVTAMSGDAVFLVADDEVRVEIPADASALVPALRLLMIRAGEPAWWHAHITFPAEGDPVCEFNNGTTPFAVDRRLPLDAYQADLAQYPRDQLPVWLAGQLHCSSTGFDLASTLRAARSTPVAARTHPFLALDTVWARWAVVAAAAVAVGTEWGPRILGATAAFESTTGGGATMTRLPRGRAVLSGGIWQDPTLAAAYRGEAPLPALFDGAPAWLDAALVNHRALTGELSFCYWWDGTGWASGQSPDPTTIGSAIPGLWTPATVVDIACTVLGQAADRDALAAFVEQAETGSATRELAVEAFTADGDTDLDAAVTQLAVAGLLD
ncbi:hypothetical protein [Nocardia sp. NPDC003979]